MLKQSMPLNTVSARQIPTRAHGFKQRQLRSIFAKPLEKLIGKPITPSEQQAQELLDGLWQGDPLMDQLVDWICEADGKQRKQLFDHALQHGIDDMVDCPQPIANFFSMINQPPAWLDPEQLNIAQEFMHSIGINANYILKDMALMGGYLLSGFNQALVLTGALNKNASQRLAETSKWWIECTAVNGLQRFSNGFKTTVHVRMIHSLVRRNLQRKAEWKMDESGLPICQIDMAATNLAFCSLFLLGLRGIGIFPTPRESKAVMHFWKYLGWIMGVDERWLVDTETDGHVLLYHTMLTQSEPDWTSKALGYALSQEPLNKHYDKLETLQRKWDYHKRLSISQFFLGRQKMRLLGIEQRVLPWYPFMLLPYNAVTYYAQRHVPILSKRQLQKGRQEQLDYQKGFGSKGHAIIEPDKKHPAYIGS